MEPDANFALSALMELPGQFAAMRDLGYFSERKRERLPELELLRRRRRKLLLKTMGEGRVEEEEEEDM